MAFTEPTPQPSTNPLAPQTATRPTLAPTPTTPRSPSILTNLPRARTAFQNKYSNPDLQKLPQQVFNSLARFDAQRVARGQSPLSERQTTGVLKTLLTEQAATPERERSGLRGIIGNTFDDIAGIATALPRIPGALINEVRAIPDIPDELATAISTSTNPLDLISNVAQVPVVRFLPGAYIAENIEDPGELLEHPVLTALDVLPLASGAARLSPTVKAAVEGAEVGQRIKPLPTIMLNKLDNGGNLTPSRIGAAVNSATAVAQATRPGQLASATWGKQSRRLARIGNEFTESVKAKMRGEGLSTEPVDQLARAAHEHNERFDDLIPTEHRVELGRIISEDPARIPDLPDLDRAYIDSYRQIQDQFAVRVGVESGELLAAVIDGRTQVFDAPTGKRVLKAQTQINDIAQINTWRNRMLDESTTADDLLGDLFDNRPGNLSLVNSAGKFTGDIYDKMAIEGLGLRGFDVSRAREAHRLQQRVTRDMIQPRRTVFQPAVQQLRALSRSDTVVAKVTDAITREDWQSTLQRTRSTKAIRDILGDSTDDFITDLTNRREAARVANQYRNYNDRVLQRAEAQVSRVESRSVPAAYQPMVLKGVRERLAEHVEDVYIHDPNLPAVLDSARQLDISNIKNLSRQEFNTLKRDVALSWRRMANELGENQPVFVHKVNPSKASQIHSPRVVPGAPAMTQTKARGFDATPYNRDLSVALSHQAVEWLQRSAADEFMDTVGTTWGRTFDDLADKYRDKAIRNAKFRAERLGIADPNTLVLDELNKLVSREWAPHKHKRFVASTTAKTDQLFIPRYLSDNIERLNPDANKILSNVVDPAMHVFRSSVLALSPRWHVYNILGGSMLLSGEAGPQAFRHVARAYRMVKEADGGQIIDPRTGTPLPPGATQGGFVSVPEEVARWGRDSGVGDKAAALLELKAGQKARQWFDQARDSRLAKAGSSLIEKSYSWNGMVDDMYRTMAYLEGYDKSITKGMSREAATQAGEGLARKILANWDEMTPIERSVIRYWFPFYGFNQFLLRYVSKYPVDHPVRASVLSNIARNEIEDHGTGLPQEFLSMFDVSGAMSRVGLGPKEGHQKMLSTRGINPFSDVSDWFRTLGFIVGDSDWAAFTSNANPALSFLLQEMGVDTRTGSAELFPDVKVDPETGRLVAESPSGGPGGLVTSFVPQSRALFAMGGWSGEFQSILENNPDAAGRFLVSSLGLPVMLRDVNIPEEQIKAEVNRQEDQDRSRGEALRTGNFGLLREYPNLREYADVLEELDAQGLLDEFKPPATPTPHPLATLVPGLT